MLVRALRFVVPSDLEAQVRSVQVALEERFGTHYWQTKTLGARERNVGEGYESFFK
jgi:hypothetical protein